MNVLGALRVAGTAFANRHTGSSPEGNSVDEKKLTVLEHLAELRTRLIRATLATAVTTGISFIFARQIFEFLLVPAGPMKPVFIEVTEMLGAYFKVALYSGLILASPILIYEILGFVLPAMTRRERSYAIRLLPAIAISFGIGIAFGYYILLPPAINFLLNFGAEIATPQIRIGNYISVVMRLILWVGIAFETPVIMFFLAKLHLVNYPMLARSRRYAYVAAFVLGAIITPTFDPINQSLVAGPLIVLFELGLLLVRFAK